MLKADYNAINWKEIIFRHINLMEDLAGDTQLQNNLSQVAELIVKCFKSGRKLLICGNGGSAADAQHIAAELTGKFYLNRKALEAEALSVNTSSITAIGNDYGFEYIFARQIEGRGKKGDVLLGISTSGHSKNVINAIIKAKDMGLSTVGLAGGNKNSKIYEVSDYCIGIPSMDTARIQEAHILICHMLCEFIEHELFAKIKHQY